MRWLVTGGLGVVGREFAADALAWGEQVTIIDAGDEPRHIWVQKHLPAASVTIYRLQDLSVRSLAGVLKDVDAVIHAAAHTGIPHSAQEPEEDWVNNVDATRRLLDALRHEPKPTVVLSSVKPYDLSGRHVVLDAPDRYGWDPTGAIGVNEHCGMRCDEPYAASKLAQSAIAQAYARSFGLPITVLRCSNLYGPAPCRGSRHGWLTWFATAAAIGRPIFLDGDGRQSRDVLYTSDLIDALRRIALGKGGALHGEILNIGGGPRNVVSCLEAIKILQRLEPDLSVLTRPARKDDDLVFVTDIRSIQTCIAPWRPRVTPEAGIAKVFTWARRHADDLRQIYEGVE